MQFTWSAEDGYYAKDTATGKPLIWDPGEGEARTFDDPSARDYALEGRFQVNGQIVTTAFTLIKESMHQYDPEWAEKITTVPAATIRRIAREFIEAARIGETITLDGVEFPFRPALVKGERGSLGRVGGAYQHLVNKMLNMLVGALDVPGGDQGSETGTCAETGSRRCCAPQKGGDPGALRVSSPKYRPRSVLSQPSFHALHGLENGVGPRKVRCAI